MFIARDLSPSRQKLDADESIDVEEFDIDAAPTEIYTGKMTDSKTVAAILAYAQREGIR